MAAQSGAPIIVGGGIAGIVAALELLRAGSPVVLLDRDREDRFGGQALESFGGILAVDTPVQRRQGVHDSVALALADWERFGEISAADGWAHRWACAYLQNCRRDVYDWLEGMGVRFLPMPLWPERRGNSVPRWHVVWGTGRHLTLCLIEALHRAAGGSPAPGRAAGLELRFAHRVERLLLEEGRVVGVAGVHESTGEPFALRAPAVVLAAGGVTGDLAQVRANWPEGQCPPVELLNGSHRYADGRLHLAARAAGARIGNLRWMWNYAAGISDWDSDRPDHGLSIVPPRSALWLDAGGRRFEPPLRAGWDTSEQVARVAGGGGYSWQILNRRIALRELAVSGAALNPSIRDRRKLAFLRDSLLGNRWLVETLIAKCPQVLAAGTLAQLVERMNALAEREVPAHASRPVLHLEAIERALRDFDAARLVQGPGTDAQWQSIREARRWKGDRMRTARPAAILDPSGGPLMALRLRIVSRKSLGGVVTDLDGRALGGDDRAIPGLYAAGEAAGFGGGGMNGRRALEGTFLGGCIYSARRAAGGLLRDAGEGTPTASQPQPRRGPP
jgi:hypothetical protein